jgi:hypothetical protein
MSPPAVIHPGRVMEKNRLKPGAFSFDQSE